MQKLYIYFKYEESLKNFSRNPENVLAVFVKRVKKQIPKISPLSPPPPRPSPMSTMSTHHLQQLPRPLTHPLPAVTSHSECHVLGAGM